MKQIILAFLVTLATAMTSYSQSKKEKMLRDSTIRFGKSLEAYLKKVSPGGKIIAGRNYSIEINKFLKNNKYVKFPPYTLTIGLDSSAPANYKNHLSINSGNRLYFPKGSKLVCPKYMKTNGNMIYLATGINDVFIDGLNLTGSKANAGYITSPYGVGIALFAPKNVIITNTVITKNSGDGIAIRTNWKMQSENIVIRNLKVFDATRVGMLITGIRNGNFSNIYIEGTGETDKNQVQRPQTALSFEPNDCESRYEKCRINNLVTKNNIGPVVATANFVNLFANNTCGENRVDVVINNWSDTVNDPNCYGASLDVATGELKAFREKFKDPKISGTFAINNVTLNRNTKKESTDYFYISGKDEDLEGGIQYKITNLKLVHRGTNYNLRNREKNSAIKGQTASSKKFIIN
jgi:hypothetical protein